MLFLKTAILLSLFVAINCFVSAQGEENESNLIETKAYEYAMYDSSPWKTGFYFPSSRYYRRSNSNRRRHFRNKRRNRRNNFNSNGNSNNVNSDIDGGNSGGLITAGNTNTDVKGGGLQGTVTSNTNCNINSRSSNVKISGNTNCELSGQNHNVQLQGTTNAVVKGARNVGSISGDTNTEVGGRNNNFQLSENTNLNIGGENNKVNIQRTTNVDVVTDGNDVEASDITNHKFTKLPASSSSSYVKIKTNPSPFSNRISLSHDVGYKTKAVIHGEQYQLGPFQFSLKQQGNKLYINSESRFNAKTVDSNIQLQNANGEDLMIELPPGSEIQQSANGFVVTFKRNTSNFNNNDDVMNYHPSGDVYIGNMSF